MKKFTKSESFKKLSENLKKDAESANLSEKQYKVIANFLTNNLPTDKPFKFTDAYVEKSELSDGTNTSHIRLKVDAENSVQVIRLQ